MDINFSQNNSAIKGFGDTLCRQYGFRFEFYDPKFDKIDKLYNKLERLQTPKYHENGRKKRTTKIEKIKMETTEKAYWREHYKHFPEDKPKKRKRRKKI